jgi:putative copper export protein
VSESDLWQIVLYLHLLAMAFFVGGQLFLAVAIAPQARLDPDSIDVPPIARRFGIGALVALAVSIATGAALASHLHLWDSPTLQVKLGFFVALFGLGAAHLRWPRAHMLQAAILLTSLVIVYLGLSLAT